MIHPDTVVQHGEEGRTFVTRRIGGETLIVPIASHVAELDSIYVLNDVGARIWDLLESPTTIDRIAEILVRDFEVSRDRARDDAAEFVGTLDERGMIRAVERT
jgi:coenzyme PQQ synthesis protein D (PqqD)